MPALGTHVEGRVTVATPLGWRKYDRATPRNVIQFFRNGIRFMRARDTREARLIRDDWQAAFYLRYPGELRRYP